MESLNRIEIKIEQHADAFEEDELSLNTICDLKSEPQDCEDAFEAAAENITEVPRFVICTSQRLTK